MTQQMTLTPRAWAGLAVLASIWGFSFLSMRIALDELGPFNVVAHRIFWAMLLLWIIVFAMRLPLPRSPRTWGALLVMGLLTNALPFSLIAWGQQHIESGLASIINASTAIWGVLVAALLLSDERLTAQKAIGVSIGFIGVATAVGLQALHDIDLNSLGQLAIIGSSLSYALGGVWARKNLKGLRPEIAAAGMLTGAAILMVPIAIFMEGQFKFDLEPRTWGALAYVSLVATGLAFILYYRVLAIAGTGNTTLCTLLVAPVAIVAGAVVLGEALPVRAYVGFGLLAIGLTILDGRLWNRLLGKKKLA